MTSGRGMLRSVARRGGHWKAARLLIVLGVGAAWSVMVEAGTVVRLRLAGPSMPEGVATEVALPPGWTEGEAVPLVVFLHDGWGSEQSYRRRGLAAQAWALMRAGLLPRAIVASPRHRGTFLMDGPRGAMESFLARDLIPSLEELFPGAGGERARRAVWGISLGGYGAIKMGWRHPEVFGRVAALAPWVQELTGTPGPEGGGVLQTWALSRSLGRGENRVNRDDNDLFALVHRVDAASVPDLCIITGGRDRWEPGALALIEQIYRSEMRAETVSIPSMRHRWSDWRSVTPEVMRFVLGIPDACAQLGVSGPLSGKR